MRRLTSAGPADSLSPRKLTIRSRLNANNCHYGNSSEPLHSIRIATPISSLNNSARSESLPKMRFAHNHRNTQSHHWSILWIIGALACQCSKRSRSIDHQHPESKNLPSIRLDGIGLINKNHPKASSRYLSASKRFTGSICRATSRPAPKPSGYT